MNSHTDFIAAIWGSFDFSERERSESLDPVIDPCLDSFENPGPELISMDILYEFSDHSDEHVSVPLIDDQLENATLIPNYRGIAPPLIVTDTGSSIISAVVHCIVLIAIVFMASADSVGQYGRSEDRVFVKLIDPDSVIVGQNGYASLESAASSPSIARKSKEKKESIEDEKDNSSQSEKILTQSEQGDNPGHDGKSDRSAETGKDIKMVEKDLSVSQNSETQALVNVDSNSNQDSVASLPSAAKQEQRSAAAQGKDADKFKKMVLSAIYKVAYFPKKAHRMKEYGEALVSFIIMGDGSIQSLKLVEKSGSELLDEAALAIVAKASTSFPAIPESLGHEKINYVVPITFKKR